jgi:hypothetical protein
MCINIDCSMNTEYIDIVMQQQQMQTCQCSNRYHDYSYLHISKLKHQIL